MLEVPDDQAAALKAKAAAQGLSLEAWLQKLAREDEGQATKSRRSPQEAAAHILEFQKRVKPDPEGWTVKDLHQLRPPLSGHPYPGLIHRVRVVFSRRGDNMFL